MIKSEFRATTEADAPAVSAFLQRVFGFGPELPLVEPRNMRWRCWEERPDWSGSRGYVVTRDERILAHGVAVPLALRSGDRRLKVVNLIDWAADPSAVGSGVVLLRRIAQMADAIVSTAGSDMTLKILPSLGFKTLGQVTRFARPVRPLRRIAGRKPAWKLPGKVVRAWWWSRQAPYRPLEGWTVRRVPPEQLASASIPWPKASPGLAFFERDAAIIGYYLRCPATPMELYTVARHGAVRGYFVLARVLTQARIVDFRVESDDREDWSDLIELAVRQAKEHHAVAEVATIATDAGIRSALANCGFQPRGDYPLLFLPRKGIEPPEEPVRVHMIDGDQAYFNRNENEFWA